VTCNLFSPQFGDGRLGIMHHITLSCNSQDTMLQAVYVHLEVGDDVFANIGRNILNLRGKQYRLNHNVAEQSACSTFS